MAQMETPGVFIVEKSAFPNSVIEAATAIPAFIGITEKAQNGSDSLIGKPWKITSMTEFQQYFGGAPLPVFTLSVGEAPKEDEKVFLSILSPDGTKALKVTDTDNPFSLYYNMVMFFANGGGTCYIVSVGTYAEGAPVNKKKVETALATLEEEREITMIIVPEAASTPDCKDIQKQMLAHCGKMMNRFAILDVQQKTNETISEQIDRFRTNIGANFLSYGAAYYPWLNTSVLSDNDIDGSVLVWADSSAPDLTPFFSPGSKFPKYFKEAYSNIAAGKKVVKPAVTDETGAEMAPPETADCTPDEIADMKNELHKALLMHLRGYLGIVNRVKTRLNLLPPSAAIAGLYTMVDNTRGVWKAPSNVSINYVICTAEKIDNALHKYLNMPINSKAVNSIRIFPGEGIKVWGAHTLDGNSQDWRYVNVRRMMIFLEESVKNAAQAFASEPNDAATWTNLKAAIDTFLRSVWIRGGLAGSTPEEAYETRVEPGDTMTVDDIPNGTMRITVLVAVSCPSKFREITFQQQMQKS